MPLSVLASHYLRDQDHILVSVYQGMQCLLSHTSQSCRDADVQGISYRSSVEALYGSLKDTVELVQYILLGCFPDHLTSSEPGISVQALGTARSPEECQIIRTTTK